jgi:hypothetical protein
LVETNDNPLKVPAQKSRPRRYVEGARGGKRSDGLQNLVDLGIPSRPVAIDEQALAQVPIVVLAGPPVVVLRRGLVRGKPNRRHGPRVFHEAADYSGRFQLTSSK